MYNSGIETHFHLCIKFLKKIWDAYGLDQTEILSVKRNGVAMTFLFLLHREWLIASWHCDNLKVLICEKHVKTDDSTVDPIYRIVAEIILCYIKFFLNTFYLNKCYAIHIFSK